MPGKSPIRDEKQIPFGNDKPNRKNRSKRQRREANSDGGGRREWRKRKRPADEGRRSRIEVLRLSSGFAASGVGARLRVPPALGPDGLAVGDATGFGVEDVLAVADGRAALAVRGDWHPRCRGCR